MHFTGTSLMITLQKVAKRGKRMKENGDELEENRS